MAALRALVPRNDVAAVLGGQLLVQAWGTFHYGFERGVRIHTRKIGNPDAGEMAVLERLRGSVPYAGADLR